MLAFVELTHQSRRLNAKDRISFVGTFFSSGANERSAIRYTIQGLQIENKLGLLGRSKGRVIEQTLRVFSAGSHVAKSRTVDSLEFGRGFLRQQVANRTAHIRHRQGRAYRTADRECRRRKSETARPRRPGNVTQLFLENAIRAVGVDSHADRNFTLGFSVADHLLHLVAIRVLLRLSIGDVLDRLLGAPHEFHEPLRCARNCVNWILHHVLGGVVGPLRRRDERLLELIRP